MLRNRLTATVGCAILFELALGVFPGSTAFAQQTPDLSQDKRTTDTITITAQKRSEDIQDVPLSVIAVGEEALRESHITQIQDLRLIDPSVQFRVSNGTINSAFSMRGVGTQTFAIGIEQSVALVLDGVTLGDPSAIATISDVDHVEILKGPQGMLFGKNASAGVISIITKDPKIGEFGGELHASYGKNDEEIIQAALNVPISDTMALRVSASRNHLKGWITDPVLNNDPINTIDDNGMRAKLLWRPNDDLKIVFGADFAYNGEFCCTQVQASTPNPLSGGAVSNAMYGVVANRENRQVTFGRRPEGKARTLGVNLNVDYDIGGGYTLTSLSAFRNSYHYHNYDADLSVFNYVDTNGGHARQRSFSQELRLTSPEKMDLPVGKFDFVGGVFGFGQDGDSTIGDQIGFVVAPALGTVTIPTNTRLSTVTGYNEVTSKSYAAFIQGKYDLDEVVHGLSFSAGLRYTRDEIGLTYRRGPALGGYSGLVGNGPLVAGQPLPRINDVNPAVLPLRTGNQYIGWQGAYIGTSNSTATGLSTVGCVAGSTIPFPTGTNCFPALVQDTENGNWSYRITVQEQFTPSIMAYATFARGYKGPGVAGTTAPNFTTAGGFPPYSTNPEAINQLVKPEIPITGEVGLKSQWLDNSLLVNLNVFSSKFKNYQTQTNVPTPNGFVGRVANAEALNLKGIELAMTWLPIDDLTLSFAGTWEKGTYGNLPVTCIFDSRSVNLVSSNGGLSASQPQSTPLGGEGCGLNAPAGQLNAKGHSLTNLPDFQYKVGANYEAPNLFSTGLTGHFNTSWNWQSKVYFNANGNEAETQDSYGILNADLGIGADDDRWRLSLYGSNILDEHFVSSMNPAPTQVLNPAGYYMYISPQAFAHYGIRLDYSF